MEIKIQKNALQEALYVTQSVIEHRSTMPILSNVLLDVKNKSLSLTATDLQVGVVVREQADATGSIRVLLPIKSLYEIIREIQGDIINIKVQPNNWVEVTSGKSKFKIMGSASDEYPAIPTAEGVECVLDAKQFLEMLKNVSYAMSNDETRYTLNGLYLECVGEQGKKALRVVATDGHRLSYSERPVKGTFKKGIILPRKGVHELRKILEGVEGEFTLLVGEKTVAVNTKNITFICRLIEGQYPPYQQVIPKECGKVLSIDRKNLQHALKRVSIIADDKSKGAKFSISPGNLDISSQNPDIGEAKEELSCVYKGETFEIGFNTSYFIDILSVLEDEKVVLELKNDTSPCVIKSEFDKGFLAVIMPMRL